MATDKKNRGGQIHFALPSQTGRDAPGERLDYSGASRGHRGRDGGAGVTDP